MKMKNIMLGLQILLKYGDGSVEAENEIFWSWGPGPEEASVEDTKTLDDLGWKWDAHIGSWKILT